MDDKDGTGMFSIKIRMTGYRHAGNYKLRGQRVRGEVYRREDVKVNMRRHGLVKFPLR